MFSFLRSAGMLLTFLLAAFIIELLNVCFKMCGIIYFHGSFVNQGKNKPK